MSSYWLDELAAPVRRRAPAGPPEVEIVGGGVTGCTAALVLAREGLRVRLHEAREIASGASGRNGGFALRGGAMPYDVARRQLGAERAQALWRLTERGLDHLEELAGDAFRRTGSLRLAADPAERLELEAEHAALVGDGFDAEWEDDPGPVLRDLFHGAIRHPGDGALHPARWVRRLAALAADAGAELREGSDVTSLDELEAPTVLLATDGYTRGLVPELDAAVRPARGQVLATEPLAQRLFACPHYARRGYDYWQQTPDGRLVVGGCRDAALETEFTAEEATTPGIQARIERLVRDLVGELPAVTHRWAGAFGVTEDRLPLAGRAPWREGLWLACGYSGHGNVLGLVCGELVAQAIAGRPAPELAPFDPGRLAPQGAGTDESSW
ncbi:MAG: NAD(P)/FAD-dependent oxidoreductase [Gaiellaceae bacterium]